jgi:Adaptor complexes medium subunit family
VEDQAAGGESRVPHEGSFWTTECESWCVVVRLSSSYLTFPLLDQDMDKRAPITVRFEIPYFTVSGIQVRYLKIVEKSGYQALPWVRYITQNGDDYR